MNKTMKKVYETPFTTHVRVEMESQLCAGSSEVTNPNTENIGGIDEQHTNAGFGGDGKPALCRIINGYVPRQC